MKISKMPNGEPEIFLSIQGEGLRIGERQIFIRMYGCNMRCSWCDSAYATHLGEQMEMTVEEIMEYVSKFNCKTVCITGGEPMFQIKELYNLLLALREYNYFVHLCTNGSVWSYKIFDLCDFISMDMKPPSSKMESNLSFLKRINRYNKENYEKFEVKVIISDDEGLGFNKEDLRFALDEVYSQAKYFTLVMQPAITHEIRETRILAKYARFIDKLLPIAFQPNVRLLPQLHKILWEKVRAK